MNYIDNDIKDFDNYIEFTTFNKFNIKILFTKKNYGNVLEKSREEIKKDFSLQNKIMVSSHQTHSDNVVLIGDNADKTYFENTDGILTSNKNVAIFTKYADCLAIFIYDEESKIFGAVHSGWKGTYQEIVKRAIEKINPKNLSTINILFGIGISCENYKVGVEFYEQFRNKFTKEIVKKTFSIKDGDFYFNNQLFNYYLLKDYGVKEDKIMVSSHQTHSDNVVLVGENTDITYFENTDGILTSNKNVAILTKYADCLPIFICDEESKIFGAVHSGWKGTYQEIIKRAIEKINPKNLSTINILFGIGISCENYKVGVEFYEQFRNKFPKEIVEKTFSIKDGDFYFNNQLFNYYLLKDYGVKEDKIFLNNRCTFKENFHSFRRDKELSGRNGAIMFMEV